MSFVQRTFTKWLHISSYPLPYLCSNTTITTVGRPEGVLLPKRVLLLCTQQAHVKVCQPSCSLWTHRKSGISHRRGRRARVRLHVCQDSWTACGSFCRPFVRQAMDFG